MYIKKEGKVIDQSKRPNTPQTLAADFRKLGIQEGMSLIVHSSLKSIGWVAGGPTAVILALQEVLGETGNLVMPTFTSDNTEPSYWSAPPVPESWWPIIRAERPPYLPDLSPTRGMGAIPEAFRCQRDTLRSFHPCDSFAARGPKAEYIISTQTIEDSMGETSPLGKLYELGAHILLIGVTHANNTSLHLAEHWANYKGKKNERQGAAMLIDGERQWVEYDSLCYDSDDFAKLGETFEFLKTGTNVGLVGQAESRLVPMVPLVDFAVGWLEENR